MGRIERFPEKRKVTKAPHVRASNTSNSEWGSLVQQRTEFLIREKNSPKSNFGKNLKYLVKSWGWSEKDIMRAFNVTSRSILEKWLRGTNHPRIERLMEFSKTVNISIDDLLTKDLSSKDSVNGF